MITKETKILPFLPNVAALYGQHELIEWLHAVPNIQPTAVLLSITPWRSRNKIILFRKLFARLAVETIPSW